METASPRLLNAMFADRPFPSALFRLEIEAASTEEVTPLSDLQDDDADACGVQVEVATSDEELPEAEGGVA